MAALLQWIIIGAIVALLITNGGTTLALFKTGTGWFLGETQVIAGNTTLKRAA